MRWLALVVLTAIAGCRSPSPVGRFADAAFYHSGGHYRVRYPEGERRLLPPDWQLANFERDERGAPTTAIRTPMYWSAPQPERRVRLGMERFDLHFVNLARDAEIFARSIPLGFDEGATLRALIFGGWLDMPGRRMDHAVRIHREGRAIVDGREAYTITFDAASREHAPQRITLVGLRARRRVHLGTEHTVLLFGYTSPPAEHESVRASFEQLIRRVDLRPRDLRL